MVDVKFVDTGSTERLWYHELYKIMDEFLVLPVQVFLFYFSFLFFTVFFGLQDALRKKRNTMKNT